MIPLGAQHWAIVSQVTRAVRHIVRRCCPPDAIGLLLVTLTVSALFVPHFLGSTVYTEGDLSIEYWPVLRYTTAQLQQGRLPLWVPELFGGFPLLAAGSSGTFFPINWLLIAWPSALMATLYLRVLLSGFSMYALARSIRLSAFGATLSGLVFALGGFSIAHLSHIDLSYGAALLPLALACMTQAFRTTGRRQLRWLLAAGVVHGLQWLGLHAQIPLISTFVLGSYGCLFIIRTVGSPKSRLPTRDLGLGTWDLGLRTWDFRLLHSTAVVAFPLFTAFGIAAAQLLPTLELSLFSTRQQADLSYRTSYSLPPYNLVTLLWPDFFVHSDGWDWGLWIRYEMITYVGLVSLILVVVALAMRPRPPYWGLLAILAAGSLWLAFGSYVPLNPQRLIAELPGFRGLRVPARFLLLFELAFGLLVGLSADALDRRAWDDASRLRLRRISRSFLVLGLLLPAVTWLAWMLIRERPGWVGTIIARGYLSLRHNTPLSVDRVYTALLDALRPDRWRLWRTALFLIGDSLVVGLWLNRRLGRGAWRIAITLLLALDLLAFSASFNQAAPLEQVLQPDEVTQFLRATSRPFSSGRTYTVHTGELPDNRLLPFGIGEVNPYFSLQDERAVAYLAAVSWGGNRLLDLWSVRYIVAPRPPATRPLNADLYYDPRHLTALVTPATPTAYRTFDSARPVPATHLILVGALAEATEIPDGTTVGWLEATDVDGKLQRWPIRAGEHLAEWAYERADVRPAVQHQLASVIYTWTDRDDLGQPYPMHFYRADFPIARSENRPVQVRRLELRYTYPSGQLLVAGMNLLDEVSGQNQPLDRFAVARFRPVYCSGNLQVYENTSALPRAFLVPTARQTEPGTAVLAALTDPEFDPQQVVMLEEPAEDAVTGHQPSAISHQLSAISHQPLAVEWLDAGNDYLMLKTEAEQPAFLFLADTWYPGWEARLDGQPTRLYRANYLFRAVYVPDGQHQVEFAYRPTSFRLGAAISIVTLVGLGLLAWLSR